jgi:hypothetical protein
MNQRMREKGKDLVAMIIIIDQAGITITIPITIALKNIHLTEIGDETIQTVERRVVQVVTAETVISLLSIPNIILKENITL